MSVDDRYRALAAVELSPDPNADLTSTLQRIVDLVALQLPASRGASIVLYDERRDLVTRPVTTAENDEPYDDDRKVPHPGGPTRRILDEGRTLVVRDADDDDYTRGLPPLDPPLGAYVGTPLLAGDRRLGVLFVMDVAPRPYTDDDLEFLTAVADRATVAIEAARTRMELQRALDRAAILQNVSVDLIGTSDVATLASRALAALTHGLGLPMAAIVPTGGPMLHAMASLADGPGSAASLDVDLREAWDALGEELLERAPGPVPLGISSKVDRLMTTLGGEALVIIPVEGHGLTHAVLILVLADRAQVTPRDLPFAVSVANELALATENASLIAELRRRAGTDQLTGVANRSRFYDLSEREHQHALRRGSPLSVLLVDIDHFKEVNDTFGHAVGDEVLREVAQRLGHGLRTTDVLARVGGEEFAALLPDTSGEALQEVAERVRAAVAERPVRTDAGDHEIRVSVGGATVDGEESIGLALRRADRRLYAAKAAGRDQIVVA